jgi:hypothetical protein
MPKLTNLKRANFSPKFFFHFYSLFSLTQSLAFPRQLSAIFALLLLMRLEYFSVQSHPHVAAPFENVLGMGLMSRWPLCCSVAVAHVENDAAAVDGQNGEAEDAVVDGVADYVDQNAGIIDGFCN